MKCANCSAGICPQILVTKCEQAGLARRKRVFQVLNTVEGQLWLSEGGGDQSGAMSSNTASICSSIILGLMS